MVKKQPQSRPLSKSELTDAVGVFSEGRIQDLIQHAIQMF
jgi:hypothetical protein